MPAARILAMLIVQVVLAAQVSAQPAPAVLRATYIAQNPVQAFVDPVSGRVRGPAADITRALAQQLGLAWTISGAPGGAGVIDRVRAGEADIGFLAIDPLRAADVDFSRAYSLSQNAFLVADGSSLCCADQADAAGIRIGVRKGDAGEFFLTRTFRQATIVRDEKGGLDEAAAALRSGALSAYAANRHRLSAFVASRPGYRILEGNFYAVEQAVAVRKGDAALLGIVNDYLRRARDDGSIAAFIRDAGLNGVDLAP